MIVGRSGEKARGREVGREREREKERESRGSESENTGFPAGNKGIRFLVVVVRPGVSNNH